MRMIKFRAWDKINKKMFSPREISFGDEGLGLTVMVQRAPRLFNECLVHGENIELMQFTGLKDRNGKEIYEGDIIAGIDAFDRPVVERVVWDREIEQSCGNGFGAGFVWTTHELDQCEVIGNEYEHPELLK